MKAPPSPPDITQQLLSCAFHPTLIYARAALLVVMGLLAMAKWLGWVQ